MSPVWLSLSVAAAATILCAPAAILTGAWLARAGGWRRTLVSSLAFAPLVLPPVFTGWVLLGLFGWIGGVGPQVLFTPLAAVLASAVVAFPLFTRSVQLAVEAVDPALEDAARTLGSDPRQVWRRITLPLALPGVVTGSLLAFGRALGEFGATILVAGNVDGFTRTLPLALFTALQVPGGEAEAFRWAMWSLGLTVLVVACAESVSRWVARRMGTAS